MNNQPGSSLEERKERGLALLEQMLGKTKAEEFKATLRELCPDFEEYVIGFLSGIASSCTVCGACEAECPNVAIRTKGGTYIIDAKKCTECLGHFDQPQCK